jgi:protein TonB
MDHSAHPSPVLPQRAVVLAAIIALHVLLIGALASGLAHTALTAVLPPIVARVVDVHPQDPVLPPPAEPTFVPPTVDPGPVPEVPYDPGNEDGGTALTLPAAPGNAPIAPAARVPAPPILLTGKNRLPNTEDYYPPRAIREGISGAANVRVCVDESGKLHNAPVVEQSTGSALLDQAAVNLTRDGRYARSTQGGMPIPNCFRFRIIFQMK